MAVIEVDLDAPPDHLGEPLPAHRYRWTALAVVAALLLTLGGAAAPAPSKLWQPLGAVPLPGDGWWTVDGDRVYTLNDTAVESWRTSPGSVSRDWTTAVPAPPAAERDPPVFAGVRIRVAGGVVLAQTTDGAASALDPATGRVRWRSPADVEIAVGGVGLSRRLTFRPGTEYNRATGDPGVLYISDDGIPHIEPPLRTDLRGVDLTTGREMWTVGEAGSIYITVAAGAVVMVASDRIALIDLRTGAIRRTRAVKGLTYAQTVGDLVLVEQGAEMLAYDARTLEPRWRAPVGRSGDDTAEFCDELVCRSTPGAQEVLDPATGAVRWRGAARAGLRRIGDDVLEIDPLTQAPWRLLDATTGAVRASLTEWESVAAGDGFVLSRWDRGSRSRIFAVARHGIVRPLGRGGVTTDECRATGRIVACRDSGSIDVFAFR